MSGNQLLVYKYLEVRDNIPTSNDDIAQAVNCSERTVVRVISQLVSLGKIAVYKGTGKGNKSIYITL